MSLWIVGELSHLLIRPLVFIASWLRSGHMRFRYSCVAVWSKLRMVTVLCACCVTLVCVWDLLRFRTLCVGSSASHVQRRNYYTSSLGLKNSLDAVAAHVQGMDNVGHLNVPEKQRLLNEIIRRLQTKLSEAKKLDNNTKSCLELMRHGITQAIAEADMLKHQIADAISSVKLARADDTNRRRGAHTKLRHQRDNWGSAAKEGHGDTFSKAVQNALHYLTDLEEWTKPSAAGGEDEAAGPSNPGGSLGDCDEHMVSVFENAKASMAKETLFNYTRDAEAFDVGEIQLWSAESAIAQSLNTYRGKCREGLATKMDAADAKLMREKNWKGMAGRILNIDTSNVVMAYGKKLETTGQPGHDGWLYSIRKNKMRAGPSGHVVGGCAGFHVAVQHRVFILVVKVEDALNKGISMPNLLKFLDTSDGTEFMASHARLLLLKLGMVAYVPFGFLAHTMYLSHAAKAEQWTHVWHMPLFAKETASAVTRPVLMAIRNYSEHCLVSEAAKLTSWTDRNDAFKSFFDEVLKAD